MSLNNVSLRVNHVSRSFGTGDVKVVALRDASLELCKGEFALLMGPSGSGKSTLLAILSGLLRPTAGQVEVHGQDYWALSDAEQEAFRREHFGFVFQNYNLFPALTALQQLEIVLRWGDGVAAREALVRSSRMLDQLGLGKKGNLRPAQLSGGEKQRVALGRALVKEPAFCFADEPTSALDWEHGQAVVRLLRAAAHERGATVLAVTHDPRLIPFADRVFTVEDGYLAEPERRAETARPSGCRSRVRSRPAGLCATSAA